MRKCYFCAILKSCKMVDCMQHLFQYLHFHAQLNTIWNRKQLFVLTIECPKFFLKMNVDECYSGISGVLFYYTISVTAFSIISISYNFFFLNLFKAFQRLCCSWNGSIKSPHLKDSDGYISFIKQINKLVYLINTPILDLIHLMKKYFLFIFLYRWRENGLK